MTQWKRSNPIKYGVGKDNISINNIELLDKLEIALTYDFSIFFYTF